MKHSPELSALNNALSIFQGQLKPVKKDSTNPFFHSHYADLTAIWDNIRESLKANGLAVTQVTDVDPNEDKTFLTTMLLHSSGQWLSGEYLLTPVKSDPQSMGSALTYARRYALSAILGIVADEDDDAEAATSHKEQRKEAPKATKPKKGSEEPKISDAQLRKIFATASQMGYKEEEAKALMKAEFGVEHTKELTSSQASDLIGMIERGESVKPEASKLPDLEGQQEEPRD